MQLALSGKGGKSRVSAKALLDAAQKRQEAWIAPLMALVSCSASNSSLGRGWLKRPPWPSAPYRRRSLLARCQPDSFNKLPRGARPRLRPANFPARLGWGGVEILWAVALAGCLISSASSGRSSRPSSRQAGEIHHAVEKAAPAARTISSLNTKTCAALPA